MNDFDFSIFTGRTALAANILQAAFKPCCLRMKKRSFNILPSTLVARNKGSTYNCNCIHEKLTHETDERKKIRRRKKQIGRKKHNNINIEADNEVDDGPGRQ